jgi:hypothetical protein
MPDRIPAKPLQEALEQKGLSMRYIARQLDWWKRMPDSQRVRRRLGLGTIANHGKRYYIDTVDKEWAKELCDIFDIDYHRVGL